MKLFLLPSEDEFESFPPAVKRKYFSTHERLKVAQGHSPSINFSPIESTPSALRGRPTRHVYRRPLTSQSANRRLKKNSGFAAEYTIADAHWFLQLPETLRRKHFSTEERFQLSGRREGVILDATDEALLRRPRTESVASLPSFRNSTTSLLSSHADDPFDPADDMDDPFFDGFRWMEDDDDLDLSLDDYHSHILSTAVPSPKRTSRRPSFRKAISAPLVPTQSLSSIQTRSPSSCPLPHNLSQTSQEALHGSLSSTPLAACHRSHALTPTSTAHYQDPDARLKIRVYLASPSKFDEALEFGFPSLHSPTSALSRRPSATNFRAHSSPRLKQTFFEEDDAALFDDHSDNNENDDGESMFDRGRPKPPPIFANRNPDLSATKPTAAYGSTMTGDREMTLRMTLTRRDLRADERLLYAQEADPLALDKLPVSKEGGVSWNDEKNNDGFVRRMWRLVSRQ